MKYLSLLFLLVFTGCTIIPHYNVVPSYGNIGDGVTFIKTGGQITEVDLTLQAKNRYNALIGIYGRDYPGLLKDDGLTKIDDNKYVIDESHFLTFAEMNLKLLSGIQP